MTDGQGELEVAAVWVPIGDLVPWEDNPRVNSAAIEAVAESIRRFGFSSPIIARTEDSQVIAGHTRLEAAKVLGLDKVPVRFLDLDPADAHLLAVADNRLSEVADWNLPDLSKVMRGLVSGDLDLSVAGFSEKELEDLLRTEILLPGGDQIEDPRETVTEVFIQVRAPASLSSQVIERVQASVEDLRGYGVQVNVS